MTPLNSYWRERSTGELLVVRDRFWVEEDGWWVVVFDYDTPPYCAKIHDHIAALMTCEANVERLFERVTVIYRATIGRYGFVEDCADSTLAGAEGNEGKPV